MNDKLCPRCGLPLEEDRPCSACLLEFAAETDVFHSNSLPELEIEFVREAFPQLEIVEMAGRGGMGTVFKARQPKLDRFIALKILPENRARHPSFAERFEREGKLLARLSHPNIVAVYDFGQTEINVPGEEKPVSFYYLMMEFIDGVDLRHAMREERFSAEQALAIVPKICDALQYAHEEGVLHRDIKPENILLDVKGRVKIADFGIASVIRGTEDEQTDTNEVNFFANTENNDEKLTLEGQIIGTPNYMAPEQFEGAEMVDARADVYSLGVVFYELLTGELPKEEFPKPSEKTPVDSEIDHIVQKALEKNREKRYQSAEEFKTDVYHTTYVLNNRPKEAPISEEKRPSRLFYSRLLFVIILVFMSVFAFHLMSTLRIGPTGMTFRANAGGDFVFSITFSFLVATVVTMITAGLLALPMRLREKRPIEKRETASSVLDERRRIVMFWFIVIILIVLTLAFFATNGPPEGNVPELDQRRRVGMFWIIAMTGGVIIGLLAIIRRITTK